MANEKMEYVLDLDLLLGKIDDKQFVQRLSEAANSLSGLVSKAGIDSDLKVKVGVDKKELELSLREAAALIESKLADFSDSITKNKAKKDANDAFSKLFKELGSALSASARSYGVDVQQAYEKLADQNKRELNRLGQSEFEAVQRFASQKRLQNRLLTQVLASSARINNEIRVGKDRIPVTPLLVDDLERSLRDENNRLNVFEAFTKDRNVKALKRAKEAGRYRRATIREAMGGLDTAQKDFNFRSAERALRKEISDLTDLQDNAELARKDAIGRAIQRRDSELRRVQEKRREVFGSTLGTSVEQAEYQGAAAEARYRVAKSQAEDKNLSAAKRISAETVAQRELNTARDQAYRVLKKLAPLENSEKEDDKARYASAKNLVFALAEEVKVLKDLKDARIRATQMQDAGGSLSIQSGKAKSLLKELEGKELGSEEFRQTEIRLQRALTKAKAAANKLGDDVSFGTYAEQQAAYDVFTGQGRTAATIQKSKERRDKKEADEKARLGQELEKAYSQLSTDPKVLYQFGQQTEFGVADEISRLELLANRFGSNAGKALNLGLEETADRFKSLGKEAAAAAKELKALDSQPEKNAKWLESVKRVSRELEQTRASSLLKRLQEGNELDRLEGLKQEENRKKYLADVRQRSAEMAQKDREAAARAETKTQAETEAYLQSVRLNSAAMAQKSRETVARQEASRKDRENRQEVRLINKGFTPENIDALRAQFSNLGYRKKSISSNLLGMVSSDPLGIDGAVANLKILQRELRSVAGVAKDSGIKQLEAQFEGMANAVGKAITQVNQFDRAADKSAKGPTEAEQRRSQREQNAQQSQARTQLLSDIGRDAYNEAGGSIPRIAKADHEATKTYLAERLKQLKAEETAISNSTMSLREQRQEMRKLGEEQDRLVMAQKELGVVMGNNIRPFRQLEMAAKAFVRYFVLYGAAYNVIYYFKNLAASIIGFQDSLKQTQVIAQASQQEMVGISSAIRDVASSTGESLQNVSAAAETLAQAGTAVANIPAALKAVSDFALATGSSLQVASDIITSAKEIFGEDLTFAGAADQLTRAVNISKLKAEDLRTIFNLGAQTAQASGLSSAQFLGASATLSNLGIKSSTIATGLRQLLLELFNPDDKTIAFLRRRYNELGERLSDQEITSRFQAFQKTNNPLLSSLTELRRLGVAGSAQDDFRRVIDIRAENVALPLVRRLDQLASNTAQINMPGAAAAGAKDRVETLSRAFDQLKVKAELLAEVMGKPLLDKLVGFTQGISGFVDSLINNKEKLRSQGGDSTAGVTSGIAGAFIGTAIGRRLGFGRLGSAVTGAAGAGAGYEVVQSSEGKPGDFKGKIAEWLLMVSSILTIFSKVPVPKGSLGKAGDTIKNAVGSLEWVQKGFEALKGITAAGILSKLRTIAAGWRALALGTPAGLIVTAYTALELLYEGYKYVSDLIKERSGNFKLKESPAADPDVARARIAEQQKKVDELSDELKNYDDNSRGSLTNEGRQIEASLRKYNERITELFGSGAEEAKAILATLGNTPIEGGTPFANEIKAKLDQIKVLNDRQFSQLVTAQSDFTAAQQSLFGKAQDILRRVSELLKKPKDQLTDTEKKFLATYQDLQNSPLFKADAFKPEELSQAVQDYFRLISDQTTSIRDRYRREQAALSAVRFGDVRTAVRSAFGQPGDNNERQALRTQVTTIRQNPSPEGQQFLDDFRSALNEVLQEIQAMPRNPQTEARLQQWITEVTTQYQDLSREIQGNTTTMDTRQQRQAEQADADRARQEDVDRRKQALAEETEKAERRYIELTTQRNNRLEEINDLDNKIKVAKEKEEYGKLLGAGGLLDQRQKAALEVAKADEELAAAKLREAALEVDPTLPRDISNLNVDQIRTLNRDDKTQSLYSQYLDKARAVREVLSDSKAQREQIQQQSLQKIEFTPDQAFIDRQNEISKLQEELGDQVRENQDQLREKYNRLFELEDKNLETQIEYLKSQEYKYTTPRDQAKFKVELNDLEQRREKLRRETNNKRDEEIARLGEAEAKAQSEVIREKIRRLERERDEIAQSSTDIRRAAGEVSGVPPAVAPMGLPTSSYTPSGPIIRRRDDAGFGVSGSALRPGAVEGIDPRMLDVLAQAVHYTNLKVDLISGKNGRSTGTTNHPDGNAFDLQLTTPDGKRLGNIRDEKAYRSYEEFGQIMNAIAKAKYPDMPFRWGGYFKGDGTRSGRGKKVNVDTMHWDNRGPATQWGDFETGAAPGLRRVYPGITSVGMGDPLAFAARLEGFQMPGGNYRAPGQGAGAVLPQPQLGAESTQRLDGINQEIEALRRQLFDSERVGNSYGKSPEEIARRNQETFQEFLTGTYDDMIKNGERKIDRSRNFISSSDRQVQLSESLLRGDTPMQGATTEQAGMNFSPAQELQYLQRVNETLQAAVSATNVALTQAQSLLTGAEGTLTSLQEEIQGYEPGSNLYEETATKIRATEQLIERYKAAVQEFGQADNEAVARLSRNLQSNQEFAPTLFGETKKVPLTNDRGEPVLNQDGTQATTDVKVLGQLDQVTIENLLGRLNELDYAFNKLGKNINKFIVDVIDTFVDKISRSIIDSITGAADSARAQAEADYQAAASNAQYDSALRREQLRSLESNINPNAPGYSKEAIRKQRQGINDAYQASEAANRAQMESARQAKEQQDAQSGLGGAISALAQEFSVTLMKTALMIPIEGMLNGLFGKADGSESNPLWVRVKGEGKTGDGQEGGAGGAIEKAASGDWMGSVKDAMSGFSDDVVGFFSKIGDFFSKGMQKGGWLDSALGAVGSVFGGLFGGFFADGGHVKGPGTGTSDSIPAWLSNGEYVLTAAEVQKIGVKNLDQWKSAMMQPAKFASGGLVGTFDRARSGLSNSGSLQGNSSSVINVIDQRSMQNSAPVEVKKSKVGDKEMIDIMVKDAVKKAINDGTLDRTMQSTYGVRRTGAMR